jgi:hypothetical protein
VQNFSYENEIDVYENEPSDEKYFHDWFRTKTRFDTAAKSNTEMAYYVTILKQPPF